MRLILARDHRPMRIAAALLLSLAGLFWAALSVDAATTHHVAITGEDYTPVDITIAAGDTVTWTNPGGQAHNVRASDGTFGSAFLTNGASFRHTFYAGGTYAYRCSIHPS